MADYLPRKAPPQNKTEEYMDKMMELKKELNKPYSPDMVSDFQKPAVKDLAVDKINTKGDLVPIKSAPELSRKKAIEEVAYDAAQMKKDYLEKAAQQGKKVFGKDSPVELNYNQLRKQMSRAGGKKLLSAVPLVGGLLSAAMSGDASAAVPGLDQEALGPEQGSYDSRLEQGQLSEQEKQALLQEQARIKALQSIK